MYTLVWGKKKGTEGNKDNKRDNREHWGQREAKGEREKKKGTVWQQRGTEGEKGMVHVGDLSQQSCLDG